MNYIIVSTKVYRDNSMRTFETKTIFIEDGDDVRPFTTLLRYQTRYSEKSKAWHNKLIQAVSLLLDYINCNYNCYSSAEEFFEVFIEAMYMGTIDDSGFDPSGLYWLPKRRNNANQLLSMLNNFSDWLCEKYGLSSLNPWKEANKYEQYMLWYAKLRKNEHSFLGHLTDYRSLNAKSVKSIMLRKTPLSSLAATKTFPETKINELLWEGFKRNRKSIKLDLIDQYNWRDMAITILMIGGGMRNSEPFHLWMQDVFPDPSDPERAIVRIYHPSEGKAPEDIINPQSGKAIHDRASYLLVKYGLLPRNLYMSSDPRHAGWKDPRLDDQRDNYMNVFWFEPQWGYVFMMVWKMYMLKLMREGIKNTTHPYAFVSLKGENKGEMLSMEGYRDNYGRAIKKIGLIMSKNSGTTPHGLRHAYGQRLEQYIDNTESKRLVIQTAMHHKSEKSQEVYTAPSVEKVTLTLQNALKNMSSRATSPNEIEKMKDWIEN